MSVADLTQTVYAPMVAGKKIGKVLLNSPSNLIDKVLSNSVLQKQRDYKEFQERFQKTVASKFIGGKSLVKSETIA